MSLAFFVEAGAHGPIEPELIALQSAQRSKAYSGIYTSEGKLRVNITYDHVIGQKTLAKTSKRDQGNANTATPICFQAPIPVPSVGLLRQLNLLEWSGLHRLLSNVAADLENIAEDDMQLLMMGKEAAEVKIIMPQSLANRALRTTRLLFLLALWLLHFRKLAQANESSMADSVPWSLTIFEEEKEIMSLKATSTASVIASDSLKAGIFNFNALDGRSTFATAVGTPEQLQAWCHREKRDPSEVLTWIGAQTTSDSSSIGSPARPASVFSSATVESDSRTARTERSSIFSVLSLRGRAEKYVP